MKNQLFEHKVSKGSRYNQIYIPRGMSGVFEVGDSVEVRLLKKEEKAYYSENLRPISEFKKKIIREIFSALGKFKEIKQAFVIGSFLTKKADYNDIDLLIVSNTGSEEEIFDFLTEKFNLKFHVIVIKEGKFSRLLEICPLTRSMLQYFASNRKFRGLPKRTLDRDYINFLLMMPEDLLEVTLGSKVFYDNIRRLLAIEFFLKEKDEDSLEINTELNKLIGKELSDKIKINESINSKELSSLRKIIKEKLNLIKKRIA